MRLIFIYGAPATGKLTIARELASLTNYRLHHNHSTIDLALGLFGYDDIRFLQLNQRINSAVFQAAADADLAGLIFTFCYGGSADDRFILDVINRYEENLCFVHLSCDVAELIRRVVSEERRRFRKVTDPEILIRAMRSVDYSMIFPHQHSLALDTTRVAPKDAALRIAEFYKLPHVTTAP